MSQPELAERIGVKVSTVVKWEMRKSLPHPRYHPSLSEALGLELEMLAADAKSAEIADAEPMSLGDYITLRRSELGMSQRELADLIGGGKHILSMWELGRRVPSRRYYARLTEYLGLDVTSLTPDMELTAETEAGPVTLSSQIRRKRLKSKLTQRELGRHLGADAHTVSNWESGKTFPRSHFHQDRLSEWLGFDVMSLG